MPEEIEYDQGELRIDESELHRCFPCTSCLDVLVIGITYNDGNSPAK